MKQMLMGGLHNGRYGAPELSRYYQGSMLRSLLLSVLLQLALVAGYNGLQERETTHAKPNPGIFVHPVNNIPNVQMSGDGATSINTIGRKTLAGIRFGIPVPIPMDAGDSAETFLSRSDLAAGCNPNGDSGDGGTAEWGTGDPAGRSDENVPPPPFRPVEKEPEIVKRVGALYPKLAVRSGIEGSVTVNVWIDKAGRVRKAEVVKSTAEIFDSAAKDAAMQWIFTPAIMNREPVSVWVSIPFRFRLQPR